MSAVDYQTFIETRRRLVLSPFAGIGSEGVQAVKFGRRFVGVELKESYFETAVRNITAVEGQQSLLAEGAA